MRLGNVLHILYLTSLPNGENTLKRRASLTSRDVESSLIGVWLQVKSTRDCVKALIPDALIAKGVAKSDK